MSTLRERALAAYEQQQMQDQDTAYTTYQNNSAFLRKQLAEVLGVTNEQYQIGQDGYRAVATIAGLHFVAYQGQAEDWETYDVLELVTPCPICQQYVSYEPVLNLSDVAKYLADPSQIEETYKVREHIRLTHGQPGQVSGTTDERIAAALEIIAGYFYNKP